MRIILGMALLLMGNVCAQSGVWPDTVKGWAFNHQSQPAPGIPYPTDANVSIQIAQPGRSSDQCLAFEMHRISTIKYALAFKYHNLNLGTTVEVDYFLIDTWADTTLNESVKMTISSATTNGDYDPISNGMQLSNSTNWQTIQFNVRDSKRPYIISSVDLLIFAFENFFDGKRYIDNLRLVTVSGEVYGIDGFGDQNVVGIKSNSNAKIPSEFTLHQNYPNPFNPATNIQYSINNKHHVLLKVYDMSGKEITTLVNAEKPTGAYKVKFDASELSSGIYFYQLQAGDFTETKKMILMR